MIVTLLLIASPFLLRQAYIQYRNVQNMYSIILATYVYMIWLKERLNRQKTTIDSEWILLHRNEFEKCKIE